MIRSGLKPTIYWTQGKHTDHNATKASLTIWHDCLRCESLVSTTAFSNDYLAD